MRLPVVLVMLAACGNSAGDDSIPPLGAGLAPVKLVAPSPADEFDIFETSFETPEMQVLTPALLASGHTTPADVYDEVAATTNLEQRVVDPPTDTVILGVVPDIDSFAIAIRYADDGTPVVIASAMVPFQDPPRDGEDPPTVHLDANAPGDIELWGNGVRCARVTDGPVATIYAPEHDIDCDGRLDIEDCNPSAYCDPVHPDAAACVTSSCVEACGDPVGDACTGGNAVECRDDQPAHRTLTCSTKLDGTCGPADGCEPPSTCRLGGASCGAIAGAGPLVCSPEVVLPYDGCHDAFVVDDGGIATSWITSITGPCTVFVSPETFDTIPPGTTFTLDVGTSAGRARVRLRLDVEASVECLPCAVPTGDDACTY